MTFSVTLRVKAPDRDISAYRVGVFPATAKLTLDGTAARRIVDLGELVLNNRLANLSVDLPQHVHGAMPVFYVPDGTEAGEFTGVQLNVDRDEFWFSAIRDGYDEPFETERVEVQKLVDFFTF